MEILSLDQLARLWSVDVNTVYGAARARRRRRGLPVLRTIRLGRSLRVLRSDADAYLNAIRGSAGGVL